MSVYEVHAGSWRLGHGWRELADALGDYVDELGFTHVELMPVMQHLFLGLGLPGLRLLRAAGGVGAAGAT